MKTRNLALVFAAVVVAAVEDGPFGGLHTAIVAWGQPRQSYGAGDEAPSLDAHGRTLVLVFFP